MKKKEELRSKLKQKLMKKAAKQIMMSSQTSKDKQGTEEFDLFLNVEEK